MDAHVCVYVDCVMCGCGCIHNYVSVCIVWCVCGCIHVIVILPAAVVYQEYTRLLFN